MLQNNLLLKGLEQKKQKNLSLAVLCFRFFQVTVTKPTKQLPAAF